MAMLTRTKPRLPDVDTIAIERIDRNPAYCSALGELQALEKRLCETEKRRRRAVARLRGAKPARSALERAKDLLAGGQVGAIDPADDLKACEEEAYSILRPAIIEAQRRLDDVHGDLSLAACQKLKPQYAATLAAALRAMQDLAAAFDAAAAIRARVREAGYSALDTVLASAVPPAAMALGDPDNVGRSQAWYWRRLLTERGVVNGD